MIYNKHIIPVYIILYTLPKKNEKNRKTPIENALTLMKIKRYDKLVGNDNKEKYHSFPSPPPLFF